MGPALRDFVNSGAYQASLGGVEGPLAHKAYLPAHGP